jgi:hypothetical protein
MATENFEEAFAGFIDRMELSSNAEKAREHIAALRECLARCTEEENTLSQVLHAPIAKHLVALIDILFRDAEQ